MESPEITKCLPDLQHVKYITLMLSIWSWPDQPNYIRVVFTCVNSQWTITKNLVKCEPLKSYDAYELSDSLLSLINFYRIEDKLATLVITHFTLEKESIGVNKTVTLLDELKEILQKRGLRVSWSPGSSENPNKPIIIIKEDIIRSYLEQEDQLSSSKLASFKKILDFWEGKEKKVEDCTNIPEELVSQIEANRKISVIDPYPFTWTIPLFIIVSQYFINKSNDPELKTFVKKILSLIDPFYTAMAVLDPRFNHWHDPVEYHDKLMTAISKAESLSLLDFSPSLDSLQNEVFAYFKSTKIPKGITPIMFWQSRQVMFPTLAQLAKLFLPISYAIVTEHNMFHDKTDVIMRSGGGDDIYSISD